MAMSQSVARSTIVVGIIELIAAIVCVVVGIVFMEKIHGHTSKSSGLWTLTCVVSGILSIAAGRTKEIVVMSIALFFNIVAMLISSAAALFCVVLWVAISSWTELDCIVHQSEYDYFSCSDLGKIKALLAVLTICMGILAIATFVGSILGCSGTCCAPTDPVVITSVPAQQSTIVVNSNQSTHSQYSQPSFRPMVPQSQPGYLVQGYVGPPAPPYGVQDPFAVPSQDNKPLVQNMVI